MEWMLLYGRAVAATFTSFALAFLIATAIALPLSAGSRLSPFAKDSLGVLVALTGGLSVVISAPLLVGLLGPTLSLGVALGPALGTRFAHLAHAGATKGPSLGPTLLRTAHHAIVSVLGLEAALAMLGVCTTGLGALLVASSGIGLACAAGIGILLGHFSALHLRPRLGRWLARQLRLASPAEVTRR